MHQLVYFNDRQQDGEHDHQHYATHDKDHDGFKQCQEYRQAPLEGLRFQVGGAFQHLFEFAADFTAGDKMDQQRRERMRFTQRARQPGAFSNALDGMFDGLAHHHVGHDARTGR